MNLLLAIAAGAASALMFASVISGAMISLLLLYLAPLPLMVAAIGWGSAGAAIGALFGAFSLALAFGLALGGFFHVQYFIAFLLTVAAPAVWLGHLVLLAQPAAPAEPGKPEPALDWYPVGRLLVWLAIFASAITIVSLVIAFGSDMEALETPLREAMTRFLAARNSSLPAADAERLVNLVIGLAPAGATIMTMAILAFNLWMASRIVATSGHLRRPWPDLSAIELPRLALVVLALALMLSFSGGLIALMAKITTAAFLTAQMMIGFATLHMVTQSLTGRSIWLGLAYASVLLFWWPAALIAVLGVFDDAFGIRRRLRQRAQPPTPSL